VIILGLSGALDHDASAAILVDGDIAAAVEEERLLRDRHAKGRMPVESARYCLEAAGVAAREVDVVAFPYAPVSLADPARWRYARRHWRAPDRALDALIDGNRGFRRNRHRVLAAGRELGIDWNRTEFVPVAHHLAHAASAYHLSGFEGRTAILCLDGRGEYATGFVGCGDGGRIEAFKYLYDPDSIAGFFGAMTEYLGFEPLDGEERVMAMAMSGDAARFDLARLLRVAADGGVEIDTRYIDSAGSGGFAQRGGFRVRPPLTDWLGPRREQGAGEEPWVHYAAAVQALFESACLGLIDRFLAPVLAETGQLAFAGGGALNGRLNRRILARDDVKALFVPPAAGDAGTSLGAAAHVAAARGERLTRMRHAGFGPGFSTDQCIDVLEIRAERPRWRRMDDVADETATLLGRGHPVAWFQGRTEFGPRPLGNRSVLGFPGLPGMSARMHSALRVDGSWRFFATSTLDRLAPTITESEHPAPFMAVDFAVTDAWRPRLAEALRRDGSTPLQLVEREVNPRFYALLEALERMTGTGAVLNGSLARESEPPVCSPADALDLFYGSDLEYLVLEDLLVTKRRD